MQAFVLAGGFATRLWPLTEKRAKPLLPLAGKLLLTHLVEKIPEGMPVTISTNAVFAKDFEEWRKNLDASSAAPLCHPERSEPKASEDEGGSGASAPPFALRATAGRQHDIHILIEDTGHEDEKLGALGAVAKWITENNVQDDVLLLAGDNYVGFSLEAFIKEFRSNPLLAAHDVQDKEKARQLGTIITESITTQNVTGADMNTSVSRRINSPANGSANLASHTCRVTAFEEKPLNPRSTLVSTGVILLPYDTLHIVTTFAKEHPDNIGKIFEHFLALKREVHSVTFSEPWFDIGSFEAYLEATKVLVGENVVHAGRGVARYAPTEENTFHGSVVIGQGSNVRKSRLRNVVLFEECEIEDCVLEDCIIDNHCVLKGVDLSHKMIRAGTTLVRAQTHTSLLPRGEG